MIRKWCLIRSVLFAFNSSLQNKYKTPLMINRIIQIAMTVDSTIGLYMIEQSFHRGCQLPILCLSQLMRLWYLSHRRSAKAQASLRICVHSPESSLFAHMKYGSRRRVRPKIKTPITMSWLCMCIWIMSLRRMKSAIISWHGSFISEESRTELSRFAKNFLPIFFNLYTADPVKEKDPVKLAVFETVKCYFQISEKSVCTFPNSWMRSVPCKGFCQIV